MKVKPEDTHLPVSVSDETLQFEGFRKVVSYSYQEIDSGQAATRELVIAQNAVAVVVFDPALEKLVMIKQFRLGAQLGTGYGMTVEIVAGLIDEGEDSVECAKRELLEETGLNASHIEPLCTFLTTPGLTTETIQLFYAEADASNLQTSGGLASETEQTFPFMLSFDEAMAALDENHVHNGIAMLGLMWFARNQAKLTGRNK